MQSWPVLFVIPVHDLMHPSCAGVPFKPTQDAHLDSIVLRNDPPMRMIPPTCELDGCVPTTRGTCIVLQRGQYLAVADGKGLADLDYG